LVSVLRISETPTWEPEPPEPPEPAAVPLEEELQAASAATAHSAVPAAAARVRRLRRGAWLLVVELSMVKPLWDVREVRVEPPGPGLRVRRGSAEILRAGKISDAPRDNVVSPGYSLL
jgi:hypothetical protein